MNDDHVALMQLHEQTYQAVSIHFPVSHVRVPVGDMYGKEGMLNSGPCQGNREAVLPYRILALEPIHEVEFPMHQ